MALDFTSDTPVVEAALSIRFDMKGLHDILIALKAAVAEGKFTIGGGDSPAAFDLVTFTFTERRDDRPEARTPTPPLALEPVD
jgi:hypothetical protein